MSYEVKEVAPGRLVHFLINAVSVLSFPMDRVARKKFRNMLMDGAIHGWGGGDSIKDLFRFLFARRRPSCVLVIEVNRCHAEVTVGFLRYFHELGYKIDVVMDKAMLDERPFCRIDVPDVRFFTSTLHSFGVLAAKRALSRYRHVVVMSSRGYSIPCPTDEQGVLNHFPLLRSACRSLFLVEHDIGTRIWDEDVRLLGENRLLTLGRFGHGTAVIPARFGSVEITGRGKVATFVVIGGIEPSRRNYDELFSTIERLDAEGVSFRVVVIGNGDPGVLSEAVRRHVELTGRLSFPEMFRRIEESDYVLMLLDWDNPEHRRYVTTGITGSAQLVYAFRKIAILASPFASFYGFDDANAIIDDDLARGMRRAVAMSADDYAERQRALGILVDQLTAESKENLRRLLS